METRPQSSIDALRTSIEGNAAPGSDEMPTAAMTPPAPIEPGTPDMKERTMHIAQSAMDMGSRAMHSITDKLHQYPSSPESSRTKGRVIAIGSMAAAGIGMAVKRRHQAKSMPQNIAERAKELVHSR